MNHFLEGFREDVYACPTLTESEKKEYFEYWSGVFEQTRSLNEWEKKALDEYTCQELGL